MRLPQNGMAFAADAISGDRDRAIAVLRRAVELGINHIDTAAFYFSSLRSARDGCKKGRTARVHRRVGPPASKSDQQLWGMRPHART